MRAGAGAVLILLSMSMAACASAGDAPGTEGQVGCYRLEQDAGGTPLGLPWGVELRGDSLQGWANVPEGRVARTLVSAGEATDHPLAYWRPAAGDSIQVGHPGSGALTLTLAPTEGGLAGWGRAGGDALVPDAEVGEVRGPVRARSVACETET